MSTTYIVFLDIPSYRNRRRGNFGVTYRTKRVEQDGNDIVDARDKAIEIHGGECSMIWPKVTKSKNLSDDKDFMNKWNHPSGLLHSI